MFSMTVIEQVRAIRDKRIGVEELTREYIERIEKFDGPSGLNSVVEFYEANPDQMMKYGNNYLSGALYDASGKLDDPKYIEVLAERKRLRSEIVESFLRFDACLMIGQTNIMHFIGLPSLALRLGMAEDGTPRGLVLYGVDERRLFAAALTIEGYCGKVFINFN